MAGVGVCRVNDKNNAGAAITTGIGVVIVNGQPIAVKGSKVADHPNHKGVTVKNGSGVVIAGGAGVAYVGCQDTCLHTQVAGSTTVFVGG